MNDILPEQAALWERFEDIVRAWLASYGYRNLRTPVLERTELFVRAIGTVTDIVEKEMYTFVDALNDESLTLRPEGTASVVRAAIEHNLIYNGPQRFYYFGPMFRHERPQKGRYRQFHQVGVEALGFAGAELDAEHIAMSARLWKLLGLQNVELQINTLGDSDARARYRTKLIAYLEQHQDALDEDGKRRLHTNPLRVLDSKNPAMQSVITGAPQLIDDIDDEARTHFETVKTLLQNAGIAYTLNPRLVRGLDYYNRTVFEWVTRELGAQGTICAGGRYDGLFEQIGGKSAPACGFALGVERVLELMSAAGTSQAGVVPDVYLVHQGAAAYAFAVAEQLRDAGVSVVFDGGGTSFKSQMKKADASGARYAVIIGEAEAAAQQIGVKALRQSENAEQIQCTPLQAADIIRQR